MELSTVKDKYGKYAVSSYSILRSNIIGNSSKIQIVPVTVARIIENCFKQIIYNKVNAGELPIDTSFDTNNLNILYKILSPTVSENVNVTQSELSTLTAQYSDYSCTSMYNTTVTEREANESFDVATRCIKWYMQQNIEEVLLIDYAFTTGTRPSLERDRVLFYGNNSIRKGVIELLDL